MLPQQALGELGEAVGADRIQTDLTDLLPYASDATFAGRLRMLLPIQQRPTR